MVVASDYWKSRHDILQRRNHTFADQSRTITGVFSEHDKHGNSKAVKQDHLLTNNDLGWCVGVVVVVWWWRPTIILWWLCKSDNAFSVFHSLLGRYRFMLMMGHAPPLCLTWLLLCMLRESENALLVLHRLIRHVLFILHRRNHTFADQSRTIPGVFSEQETRGNSKIVKQDHLLTNT